MIFENMARAFQQLVVVSCFPLFFPFSYSVTEIYWDMLPLLNIEYRFYFLKPNRIILPDEMRAIQVRPSVFRKTIWTNSAN